MSLPPEDLRIPLAHLVVAPDPARRFRLLEIVRRRLRERRYSRRTEEAYIAWIRRYVIFPDRATRAILEPRTFDSSYRR